MSISLTKILYPHIKDLLKPLSQDDSTLSLSEKINSIIDISLSSAKKHLDKFCKKEISQAPEPIIYGNDFNPITLSPKYRDYLDILASKLQNKDMRTIGGLGRKIISASVKCMKDIAKKIGLHSQDNTFIYHHKLKSKDEDWKTAWLTDISYKSIGNRDAVALKADIDSDLDCIAVIGDGVSAREKSKHYHTGQLASNTVVKSFIKNLQKFKNNTETVELVNNKKKINYTNIRTLDDLISELLGYSGLRNFLINSDMQYILVKDSLQSISKLAQATGNRTHTVNKTLGSLYLNLVHGAKIEDVQSINKIYNLDGSLSDTLTQKYQSSQNQDIDKQKLREDAINFFSSKKPSEVADLIFTPYYRDSIIPKIIRALHATSQDLAKSAEHVYKGINMPIYAGSTLAFAINTDKDIYLCSVGDSSIFIADENGLIESSRNKAHCQKGLYSAISTESSDGSFIPSYPNYLSIKKISKKDLSQGKKFIVMFTDGFAENNPNSARTDIKGFMREVMQGMKNPTPDKIVEKAYRVSGDIFGNYGGDNDDRTISVIEYQPNATKILQLAA